MSGRVDAFACALTVHEGTLLYSDEERTQVVVRALVQIVAFDTDAEVGLNAKTHGELGSIVQALALFMERNPGLHEAVGGMLTMRRASAQWGSA